jgi:SAM-dependent methyltransferase
VALSVNNVSIWPDRLAGCAELARALRPGGRLLLSTHQRWLPGGLAGLAEDVAVAGFVDIRTWIWHPPGRFAIPAAELAARAPQQHTATQEAVAVTILRFSVLACTAPSTASNQCHRIDSLKR